MSAIIRVFPTEFRERLARLALVGLSSPSTLRAYSAAIDEFLTWAPYQPVPEFSKAPVQQYKSMLIEKELAPSTINQRLAAVHWLTTEAADAGDRRFEPVFVVPLLVYRVAWRLFPSVAPRNAPGVDGDRVLAPRTVVD